MSASRITVTHLPVYPDTVRTLIDPEHPDTEEAWREVPHPRAGRLALDALQLELGETVWVGPGSRWALPREAGVVPITVTADYAPSPSPDQWQDVANLCLALAVKYNTGAYPTLGEICGQLAGRDLADSVPDDQPSHVDVLLALANGLDFTA